MGLHLDAESSDHELGAMLLIHPAWLHLLLLLLVLTEGRLVTGTCELVQVDQDRNQPRRSHQTARCICEEGQIAGIRRAKPACVDVGVITGRQWCKMSPCLADEGCTVLLSQSGWTCRQPGGRIKTTTVF